MNIGAIHAKTPSEVPNLREKLTTGEAFPKKRQDCAGMALKKNEE